MPRFAATVLTSHLLQQAGRRGLSLDRVRDALAEPDSIGELRPGRFVAQKAFEEEGRTYLLRVIVDVDRQPPEAVSAYRTSKIRKYGGPA